MKKLLCILTATTLFAISGCSGIVNALNESITTQSQITEQSTKDTQVQSETQIAVSATALEYPEKDYLENLNIEQAVRFADGDEIMITQSGTYLFSGDYTNSTITVNVDKDTDDAEVYLVLDNANISSDTSAPINIMEAKDVIIVLQDGSQNTITQGAINTTDEEFPSGAIYSAADTVITGDGSLTVTTEYNDGINGRDDLVIENTNITVNAVSDGIVGKDLLAISGSTLAIDAGKDGLKSSNAEDTDRGNIIITSGEFSIVSQNDGISAENMLQIDGGNFEIVSGGGFAEVIKTPSSGGMGGGRNGFDPTTNTFDDENDDLDLEESMKGIKSVNSITVNGGEFNISSYEDAVHSNGDININGGEFTINAGDDGFHADYTVNISQGNITIENCFEGIEGIYVNISDGDITINTDDDGINGSDSTGGVTVSGGSIEIAYGQGGDGIDSNGFFTQSGGDIVIVLPQIWDAMNAPLDVYGTVTFSGGTIVDNEGNQVEATGQGDEGGGMGGQPGGTGAMPGNFEGGGTMPNDFEGGGMGDRPGGTGAMPGNFEGRGNMDNFTT